MIQPADVEVWLIAIMQKNRPRAPMRERTRSRNWNLRARSTLLFVFGCIGWTFRLPYGTIRYYSEVSDCEVVPKTDALTESGCLLKSTRGPSFFCVGGVLGAHEACVAALGLKPLFVGLPKFHD